MMAEDEILKVDLGAKGRSYYEQQFANYSFTKMIKLAANRSTEITETFAFLPKGFAQQAANAENYRWGIGMSLKNSPTRPPLVDFIRNYLDQDSKHVCVMENADARKDYPYVAELDGRIFFDESDLYHLSLPGDSCEQIDCELLTSGCLRYFFAVLTSPNDFFVSHPEGRVEFQHLDTLVHNARFFITTAWDEEGYVIARLGETRE